MELKRRNGSGENNNGARFKGKNESKSKSPKGGPLNKGKREFRKERRVEHKPITEEEVKGVFEALRYVSRPWA